VTPPPEVDAMARERADARSRRDWGEADRLRARIEDAGWKVIDTGLDYRLEPAHPPDLIEDGRVRYGSSRSVPSRLDLPAEGTATVALVATDHPDDLQRALAGVTAHAPAGTSVVVVADAPGDELEAALAADPSTVSGRPVEVVWTSERLGHAAALNAAFRRASAAVIVVLDPSVEPMGDFVTPLVAALEDASVAIAGGFGLRSRDMRTFTEAPAGDVDAVAGYCLAFRREDVVTRGPLDERFRFYRNLDVWWSLALRDEGRDAPPRRAVALDLPLVLHEHRGWESVEEPERSRLSKRNFYRVIDRFGGRRDLLGTG
jgi:hypothetical protein